MKMKTRILLATLLSTTLFLTATSRARADYIRSFNSDIHVQADTSIDVTETIVVDFEKEKRHGIYRNIPVKNSSAGKTSTIDLKVISVTDSKAKKRNYKLSPKGTALNIKIGDADKLITGVQTYRIRYVVKGAIQWSKDRPVLNWNVMGNEWPYPASLVTADLFAPKGTDLAKIGINSFVGPAGSRNKSKVELFHDHLHFLARNLLPDSDMTIAATFPSGALATPSP